MATTSMTSDSVQALILMLRPVARWVSVVDDSGRSRLVMRWHVPDADEALPTLLGTTR